jgi:two-component system, NarL family, response regulator NreC
MTGGVNLDAGPITVVLADDHTVMRNGLRMLLEAEDDLRVLADVGTIQLVFQEVRGRRPDVLVLDLNMPGGSSLDAIRRIAAFSPETAVVVLTMEDDPSLMRAAYDAGAHSYVLKEAAATQLVRAIHQASRPPSG